LLNSYYYSKNISEFISQSATEIIGQLTNSSQFDVDLKQRSAWNTQIVLLKESLKSLDGRIYFEFTIPRMGSRVDVILIIKNLLFILEFKVGESNFLSSSLEQVLDYALDLKNFHKPSHKLSLVPILIATEAQATPPTIKLSSRPGLISPIKTNGTNLTEIINRSIQLSTENEINADLWENGQYQPTPTIIEAALALYNNHNVTEITRTEAEAINLTSTSKAIENIINRSKKYNEKAICFVTGVPGAGKTLVGLNIATQHIDKKSETSSVFLSGNGPLVSILREAITRDKIKREKQKGLKPKKGEVFDEVKLFIQNVHHFRDDNLRNINPPYEHIAIFDEAQRAWDKTQTASFMKTKKGVLEFNASEPEFLISCMDRHMDWAVIICLVGGGQEINKGESGISEWIDSINRSFNHWNVYMSDRLTDTEYAAGNALNLFQKKENLRITKDLHLSVSLRSFRAERLSFLIKYILDLRPEKAEEEFVEIKEKYPIVLTRDLQLAKKWIRQKALGSERYGLIVSSQAQRLKPHAIDVKSPIDPIHWFLDGKEDVRSSYYLEDVATEFHVQGLELDWTCVTWDADFRYSGENWQTFSFKGDRWENIRKDERQRYLKNAYRVLLTRARQGMVIVVPNGDDDDHTRKPEFYDATFNYLKRIGFTELKDSAQDA
jgi:hypothetical protein